MDHMADQWPSDTITKTYQEPQNMNSSRTTCTVFAILATILIKFQFLTVAALMNCDDFWQSAEHVLMDGRPLLAMASVTASSSRLLPPGNLQQIHFERFDPFLTFLSSGFFINFPQLHSAWIFFLIYLETFGIKLSVSDSSKLLSFWCDAGYKFLCVRLVV